MSYFCRPCKPDKLVETSPLSRPVPFESCFSFRNGSSNKNQSMDADMTDIDDKNVEASALCEQMENLNIVDQDAAENTVLGNTAILEGHANFNVTTKLEELASRIGEIEMKLELGNVIDHDFEAYRLAREQNSKYVSHHSFTVGFLRAELYDTKNAAWRMFRYLRIKLDLFGIEKLTQDILIDDLGEDGKRYLARGGLQVLPQRDTSGRRVVFGTGVLNGSGNASDVIGARKAYFYFWTSISEDDTEKGRVKGVAGLLWRVHQPPMPDMAAAEALRQIWFAAPLKISAYHMCYAEKSVDGFAKMCLMWFMNQHSMRYRRAHFDKATETMYKMFTKYGIPSGCFPINHDTVHETLSESKTPLFHTHHHRIWLEHRISLDREKKKVIDSLQSADLNALLSSMRTSNGSLSVDRLSFSSFNDPVNPKPDDLFIGDLPLGDDTIMKSLRNSNVTTVSTDTINAMIVAAGMAETDDLIDSFEQDLDESQFLSENLMKAHMSVREAEIAPRDIKLGRGKPLQRHPGNMWFRDLISQQFKEYESMDKRRQTEFSRHIVTVIKGEGRKFWSKEQDSENWIEVDDDAAREKVAVTFRTERKKRQTKADRKNRATILNN